MNNEELKARLLALEPGFEFAEGTGWLNGHFPAPGWLPLATRLKSDPELAFDYLFCLTCIDWKTHLDMVYHLHSTTHRHFLVAKSKLDRENPVIESVAGLWRTAEFHEREVYELFGVQFQNHPDLRKLILPDDWEGYPLRKDYEDPINMIKL